MPLAPAPAPVADPSTDGVQARELDLPELPTLEWDAGLDDVPELEGIAGEHDAAPAHWGADGAADATPTSDGAGSGAASRMRQLLRRPRRQGTMGYTLAAPALAAALAVAVYVLSGIIRGAYPFGAISRSTNDLGQQVIPMHAYYRDVLTGAAPGGMQLNWNSGYGVTFLGDFMSYVGLSLGWVATLFPRDRIDLALYVIALIQLAAAAALMTIYLRRTFPGRPWWLGSFFGASYAVGAWAMDDGIYMTVWLTGLTAFPLLCYLGDRLLTRARLRDVVVSAPIISLLWMTHFYTVYMATIGAILVTVTRAVTVPTVQWRVRLEGIGRAALTLLLGIAMAAVLLMPTLRAVEVATPSPDREFTPLPWSEFLSRFLPGTEGVGFSPSFSVGVLALIFALTFPLNRAIPLRSRIGWTLMLGVTVISMRVFWSYYAWHAFDSPNGSQYRQSFVVSGMVVILAWMSARARPKTPELMFAAAAVLVLWWSVRTTPFATPGFVWITPITIAALTLGALLVRRNRAESSVVGFGVLISAVLVSTVWSTVDIDTARAKVLAAVPPWGATQDQARAAVATNEDWPASRSDPGLVATYNAPMLIGGQGGAYYSSTIPYSLTQTLSDFGWGYASYGRSLIDPDSPVASAIFATTAKLTPASTNNAGDLRSLSGEPTQIARTGASPLVTVRPKTYISQQDAPFGAHETALGARLYRVPEVTFKAPKTAAARLENRGWVLSTQKPDTITVSAKCAPLAPVYLSAPRYVGQFRGSDGQWRDALTPKSKRPGIYSGAELKSVGNADEDGKVSIDLKFSNSTLLPRSPIGCLNVGKLTRQVTALQESAPQQLDVGRRSIEASWDRPVSGQLVIATSNITGWTCQVDQNPPFRPGSTAGLMSTWLDGGQHLRCDYAATGVGDGVKISLAALLAWVLLVMVTEWRYFTGRPSLRNGRHARRAVWRTE